MSNFMNDYDIENARAIMTRATLPNALGLVMVVDALREWADWNSDGWAYWPKPVRAASRAIDLIHARSTAFYTGGSVEDVTDAEMTAAVRPIKAFLTRQGVEGELRERILRGSLVIS